MSATEEVIEQLPIILKDGQPQTQADIWAELIKDDRLKTMLFTTGGGARKGVLQGITTRIKQGKLKGLAMVTNELGHSAIAYVGTTIKDQLSRYQTMLVELSSLDITSDLNANQRKQWERLMVQTVSLNRNLIKFGDQFRYNKMTEIFYPNDQKMVTKKNDTYPISKFKNKPNKGKNDKE